MQNKNTGGISNPPNQPAQSTPTTSTTSRIGGETSKVTDHQLPSTSMQNTQHISVHDAQVLELERRILSLNDESQRDDLKLKTLQDIWQSIEQVYNLPAYYGAVEKLINCFILLFCNTSPQFISENNTQQLRKLSLEIILRLTNTDAVKSFSKDIMKQMMRLIAVENEENAILAIKIIIDQGRSTGRLHYSNEVTNAMTTFKKLIVDLTNHGLNTDIFQHNSVERPYPGFTEEKLIEEYLKNCFHSQSVSLSSSDDAKFSLIPMASQSVKVLQEIPMLVVFFYQHQKSTVQTDALEFVKYGLNFLNVRFPSDRNSPYNHALIDDFFIAQAKFLSFVNIMGKIPAFMEVVVQNGDLLVSGVLQLLEKCPPDLISSRKDVLIALKYLASGDLRNKFFPLLPRLLSETALIGTGFTAVESLRTFMYQMLADLLHHMRATLSFDIISHVSFVFCRQMHDPSTSYQVQIMCSRLLNSITEGIKKMEAQNEPVRDLLLEILEALVVKLKVIAYYHLPLLFEQYGSNLEYEYKPPTRKTSSSKVKSGDNLTERKRRRLSIDSLDELELTKPDFDVPKPDPLPKETKDGKHNSPSAIVTSLYVANSIPISISDGRSIIKFIFYTFKSITFQLNETRESRDVYGCARERDLFERLLKYGIMCMDMFVLPTRCSNRTKEEKETLEALANVFATVNGEVFKDLFDKYMDFLIDRVFKNFPLQLMVNTFLVRSEVPHFASVMLSFLMSRLKFLAVNNEKTALYVKLFKIIFSAIGSQHPNVVGERMLKPFLPDLIRKATIMALSAPEPLNYFLLLRALFRSIGGGAHDILYGKFLPLLPNLLQFLNKLQSGQHRIQMRELFIELCLTVPVRLSSLLPYLPLLMDPLVCALNGSQGLVQQGLRTLELCVDNLQPEFLFEHMAPVRGALMQGLWRVVATSNDRASTAVAFRILGKFGGANRKMLNVPQTLQFAKYSEISQSFVNLEFSKMGLDGNLSVHLALSDIMKTAVEQMRLVTPVNDTLHQLSIASPPPMPPLYLRKQCMELARSVLLTGLGPTEIKSNDEIKKMAEYIKEKLMNMKVDPAVTTVFKCTRENDRELFINALLILFYGLMTKDVVRQQYLKFFNAVLRQLTLIGVLEYIGGKNWIKQANDDGVVDLCMDSSVLVDALAAALSDSNKDFSHSAMVGLMHIKDTCAAILPSMDLMSKIPFCRYLIERIMRLCNGPSWFTRLGGSIGLTYMIDSYPRKFIEDHMNGIIDSLVEVLLGTVDEISSGSIEMALEGLEKLQKQMFDDTPEKVESRLKVFVSYLAPHFFHANADVREKIRKLLSRCNELTTPESSMNDFYYKFRDRFVPDIERTLNTTSYMSLADASGSLDSIYEMMNVEPDVYEFEKDEKRWQKFIKFIIDMTQTETDVLLQRPIFKKCETCAAHFLPPIPIKDQIDVLRTSAAKCVASVCYRMKKNVEQNESSNNDKSAMETDNEYEDALKKASDENFDLNDLFDDDVKSTYFKMLIIGIRVIFNLKDEKISKSAHDSMVKLQPLPLEVLNFAGKPVIEKMMNEFNGSERIIDVDSFIKLLRLFELNQKILTRDMAEHLANFVRKWKYAAPHVTEEEMNGEEDHEQILEREKNKNWEEVEMIGAVLKILSRCDDLSVLSEEIATSVISFFADFEYGYLQDILYDWISDVPILASKYPKEATFSFFTGPWISKESHRALLRRIIKYPECFNMRQYLMENTIWIEKLLEFKVYSKENNDWVEEPYDELKTYDKEMFVLSLIDSLTRLHPEWYLSEKSPINRLKELWNSTEFKQRYVVRSTTEDDLRQQIVVKYMTAHKYKVPKLVVNCLLRYLRIYYQDFELLFDVLTVFIGNYVTDFTFVREYLENEVIPVMPIEWRREAFLKIMEMFESNPEKARSDLRVVKAMQYLIIPCLQWAFERYDVDKLVGPISSENETDDFDPNNLVSRLSVIIDVSRQHMSDGIITVFYQLCILLVQHAPHHIHNNNAKKQGGRLRYFMLFAWPCLTLSSHQDPTIRFTGFHFLSYIIERFTINRKIVLQVFHALTASYHQDHRDQVRKAIDILTPAIPIRMDDGHLQILNSVRKVLIDECHNLLHVQHVFQMIIRNYRVYFHVRHELLTPIMNAIHRAHLMPNSIADAWVTRRIAIEVCEMVIKWDLLRNEKLEAQAQITAEEAQQVDHILEQLKGGGDKEKDDEHLARMKKDVDDSLNRPISKDHVDQIINLLVKFCISFQITAQAQQQMQATAVELIKKCQGLLRAALKPCVWGETATIRPAPIDKHLSIPADIVALKSEGTSSEFTARCSSSQASLDLLLNLVNVMPKQLLMQTIRPLQRAIITCLNSGVSTLIRSVGVLVGRLFEKTNTSVTGLDEFEMLNQFLQKYLNDQFMSVMKNQQIHVSQVYTSFSLLRTICSHQPGYLDAVCLVSFLRITERAIKDHFAFIHAKQDGNREKAIPELICISLDLLEPRISYLSSELRRTISINIIGELVRKTNYEKLIISCLKLIAAIIMPSDIDFTIQISLPLLVTAQDVVKKNYRNSKDVVNALLNAVVKVYEIREFRTTEYGSQLWDGFFWGLSHSDADTRDRFLLAWENSWPHLSTIDMCQRMTLILRDQDWSKFGQYFWLRHALWSMLRCVNIKGKMESEKLSGSVRKLVLMLNCASLWNTFEISSGLKQPTTLPMDSEEMDVDKEIKTEIEDEGEHKPIEEELHTNMETNELTEYENRLQLFLTDQQPLMEEAAKFDFAQSIDCVSNFAFSVSETKFVESIWVQLFRSFWQSLTTEEMAEFQSLIVPFLSSGTHNVYVSGVEKSVLKVWLEAVSTIIPLPSTLTQFIASRHECWHTGIRMLEKQSLLIPKQLNNQLVSEVTVFPDVQRDIDTLDSLALLYSELSEFDQFAAVWNKRALTAETPKIIAAIQMSDMETASKRLESAMMSVHENLTVNYTNGTATQDRQMKRVTPILDKEYDTWMDLYMKCCSELLQWKTVADLCNHREMQYARGMIEAATHLPDWAVVEECRNQIAGCIPAQFYSDFSIYNMMLTVIMRTNFAHETIEDKKKRIKAAIQNCTDTHIAKWRALPTIVTYSHAKILQTMNIIREVEESMDVRCSLEETSGKFEGNLLQEMKNLIKIWRNRGPTISDDLSFVGSLYDWRAQIHSLIVKRLHQWDKIAPNLALSTTNHSILSIHSSAQGQLATARSARLMGFNNVAKDLMNKLACLTAVPMLDAHTKICDYAKTLRSMAIATKDDDVKEKILLEAVDLLQDVRITDFNREQIAKIYYQRGNVHSLLNQADYAEKCYKLAAQLFDFKVNQIGAVATNLMKSWGHHTYRIFFSHPVTEDTASSYGRQSVHCYFMASRIDLEPKARKYIARIMWLAKHLSICGPRSHECLVRIVKKQLPAINVFNWLYWLPQLVLEVEKSPNSVFVDVLIKICPHFPMQVFNAVRNVLATPQIDKIVIEDAYNMDASDDELFLQDPPLVRVVKICLKYRPTDVRVFHRVMKEMDGMAEFWSEKHIRFAINLKDQIFFDLSEKMDATFNDQQISEKAQRLMKIWRTELEKDLEYYDKCYSLSDEELKNRKRFDVQRGYLKKALDDRKLLFEKEVKKSTDDLVHSESELTFVRDTSSTMIKNLSLSVEAIQPLKFVEIVIAWIKSLKRRISTLPKKIPLEATSAFLSRFSHRVGCIEMPYDLLNVIRVRNHNSANANQSGQYVSLISRFEPNLEVAVKGGQVMRRFNIRGQTGKSCAFYLTKFLKKDRVDRVPQFFAHVNTLLQKDRETARRHLHVPIITQLRVSKQSVLYEIASIHPYIQTAECGTVNPASAAEIIHPIDIVAKSFSSVNMTPDDLVHLYYDRFSQVAKNIGTVETPTLIGPDDINRTTTRSSPDTLQPDDVKKKIYEEFINEVVSNRIIDDYMSLRYPDNTMYYMFRKQFVHCLAVQAVLEYHCSLTPMFLDQILLNVGTGVFSNPHYRFELSPAGTRLELVNSIVHDVPFRLTPNFTTLIGMAMEGDFMWSMAAMTKCMGRREPEIILRPLLWDEHADNLEKPSMIYVCHATNSYVNGVMKKLEHTNSDEAKIRREDTLSQIYRSRSVDNLSRMPPPYHGWV